MHKESAICGILGFMVASFGACGVVEHQEAAPDLAVPTRVSLHQFLERVDCQHLVSTAGRSAGSSQNPSSEAAIHVLYIWSPSLPLSLAGMKEAQAAVTKLNYNLTIMPASELLLERSSAGTQRDLLTLDCRRGLRDRLVAAGATLHYPSVTVFRNGRLVGPAITGFRRAATYEQLVAERSATKALPPSRPAQLLSVAAETPPAINEATQGQWRVMNTLKLAQQAGVYIRAVPGSTLLSYAVGDRTYLHDYTSDRRFVAPGWVDFIPSPDGLLFVTPAKGDRGMEFYLAADIQRAASIGWANRVEPFHRDSEMTDQYPSVGLLEISTDGTWRRYRVVTAFFDAVALRDYELHTNSAGKPVIRPLTAKILPCPGRRLSLPMVSADGTELAARDDRTGTTRIFSLKPGGECEQLVDLGIQTGKVGFSDDGSKIAYAVPDMSSGSLASVTFIHDRLSNRSVRVPGSSSAGLAFPTFIGSDSLIVQVADSVMNGSSEIRIVCCAEAQQSRRATAPQTNSDKEET